MDCADDWGFEAFVFRRCKAAYHYHQGIDLREVETNFLGLGGDVLEAFAAVDFDDLILIGIFQESEESTDQVGRDIPLDGILIDLSRSIKQKFSEGSHGFASDFFAFVFGDGLNKTRNDTIL